MRQIYFKFRAHGHRFTYLTAASEIMTAYVPEPQNNGLSELQEFLSLATYRSADWQISVSDEQASLNKMFPIAGLHLRLRSIPHNKLSGVQSDSIPYPYLILK